MKANEELRASFKKNGVHQWQVADALGIAEGTLARWLRKELPAEKKAEIEKAISDVLKGANRANEAV